jgi:phytoene synthase
MSGSSSAHITRKSRSNFYYAFLTLPPSKRRGIYALYSFCRVVDDCVDEEDGGGETALDGWLAEVERCYGGRPETDLGRELAETVLRFSVPRAALEDIVAGCRTDLTQGRYPTWADLRLYCERVASAVGLASIEIFGYSNPRTRDYAVELGLALQLTNILRDVASDAARGRLYLPLEDLARFGVREEDVLAAAPGSTEGTAVGRVLAFEAERARQHFANAAEALPPEDRRSMLAAEIMGAIYRHLLEKLARRGYPVGGERVRIPRPAQAWIMLRTAARVYGGA